jgi:hypothetical protein
MIIIEYSKNGQAVSDFEATDFVLHLFSIQAGKEDAGKNEDVEANVSTENVIHAARVFVKKGISIWFKYNDKIIIPDKNGRIKDWPDGFCDTFDKVLMELLDER